eukprot:366021-Chlamydomonas_euryale.AAC.11
MKRYLRQARRDGRGPQDVDALNVIPTTFVLPQDYALFVEVRPWRQRGNRLWRKAGSRWGESARPLAVRSKGATTAGDGGVTCTSLYCWGVRCWPLRPLLEHEKGRGC